MYILYDANIIIYKIHVCQAVTQTYRVLTQTTQPDKTKLNIQVIYSVRWMFNIF